MGRQGQELQAAWDHPETQGLGAKRSRARFVSGMGVWESVSVFPGEWSLITGICRSSQELAPHSLGVWSCAADEVRELPPPSSPWSLILPMGSLPALL